MRLVSDFLALVECLLIYGREADGYDKQNNQCDSADLEQFISFSDTHDIDPFLMANSVV
jgi:hypothetical protein